MTTPDEIRDHNDKILAAHDRLNRVHAYFESIGSTSEQAATAAKAHAEKFEWNGAVLSFQGKPVADPDNGVREWFTKNKLDFLLPPPDSTKQLDVDADLLAKAKAGNMTARSQLFVQVGRDQSKLDDLLAAKSDDIAHQDADAKANKTAHATNPFSRQGWSITKQGALLRSGVPMEKVAAIAAGVGARIGDTTWNKNHPANR